MEKTLFKLGWYKIPGWECLYAHREKGLFMSVYVDDFKMVGRKEKLADMWTALREDLDLEPETELSHNVYFGCNQREAPIQPALINEKNELFHRLTTHEA